MITETIGRYLMMPRFFHIPDNRIVSSADSNWPVLSLHKYEFLGTTYGGHYILVDTNIPMHRWIDNMFYVTPKVVSFCLVKIDQDGACER